MIDTYFCLFSKLPHCKNQILHAAFLLLLHLTKFVANIAGLIVVCNIIELKIAMTDRAFFPEETWNIVYFNDIKAAI